MRRIVTVAGDGMTSTESILEQIRQHRADLRALGARRLGIFGSFARGEQRADSDLDVLVELDQRTFDRYMDLKLYLEDLLGLPVDLMQADRVRPELRTQILGELVDAA